MLGSLQLVIVITMHCCNHLLCLLRLITGLIELKYKQTVIAVKYKLHSKINLFSPKKYCTKAYQFYICNHEKTHASLIMASVQQTHIVRIPSRQVSCVVRSQERLEMFELSANCISLFSRRVNRSVKI